MTETPTHSKYIFLIDTDEYAGNFERDLCAYMTGMIGECGVGDDCQKIYAEDKGFGLPEGSCSVIRNNPYDDMLVNEPDDHGCGRPTSIWKSSNGLYNSVAIFFLYKPTKEMIEDMKQRAVDFSNHKGKLADIPFLGKFKVKGFRLIKVIPAVYEELEAI